jgi:ATP-dependent helicase/nuclease subunit A
VLVQRRDATFEEIIRACKLKGVPVAGADRLHLSEHIAFQDLMALVRFVQYPDDDLTLATLLRSPFCDVDEAEPVRAGAAAGRRAALARAAARGEGASRSGPRRTRFLRWAQRLGGRHAFRLSVARAGAAGRGGAARCGCGS